MYTNTQIMEVNNMPETPLIISEDKKSLVVSDVDIIKARIDNMTMMILWIDGTLIRFIEHPTDEEIIAALAQNLYAVKYLPKEKQTPDMWKSAAKQVGSYENIWDDVRETDFDESTKIEIYQDIIITNIDSIDEFYDKINSTGYDFSLWTTVITNICYVQYYVFRSCPFEDQLTLIDKAMDISPAFLQYADVRLWTIDRVIKYLTAYPDDIGLVKCKVNSDMFVYQHNVGLFIDALNASNTRFVATQVLDELNEDVINNIKSYETLLSSKNWKYVIGYRGNSLHMDREKATLIFRMFTVASLVENVPDHERLKEIIKCLPLSQRIHYSRELKRELKNHKGGNLDE